MNSFTSINTGSTNNIAWHNGKPFVQERSQSTSSSAMAKPVEKKFICEVCNKDYADRKGLWRHNQSHEGMKYQCRYEGCDKKFSQTNNLIEHEKSKHKDQSYLCQIDDCNQEFGRLDNFKRHQINIHTK